MNLIWPKIKDIIIIHKFFAQNQTNILTYFTENKSILSLYFNLCLSSALVIYILKGKRSCFIRFELFCILYKCACWQVVTNIQAVRQKKKYIKIEFKKGIIETDEKITCVLFLIHT